MEGNHVYKPETIMTDVSMQDLQKLLVYFSKNTYRARDADNTSQSIMQRCVLLADMDYQHSVINNNEGDLSAHYPSHLIILEYEKSKYPNKCDTPPPPPPPPLLARTTETIYESMCDPIRLKELIKSARFARCRSRFPLPVILYKGKYICRSSTLSGGPEIYGRSGLDYLFAGSETGTGEEESSKEDADDACGSESFDNDSPAVKNQFDKVRKKDIKLLKTLKVGHIIDFMVENKKVKFLMNVTSSEKVDSVGRYSDFNIVSLPYPGCEFFKEFREHNYAANHLVFDWTQAHVDANIGVPKDEISGQLPVNWEEYRDWDLLKLTQNYLKLILRYMNESDSGILIHCISGWDRTPLFISLLRLSLWADGAIHTSLNAYQVLYFTIAYDWMLFGHDLKDRMNKGEEIFFFCFFFLKHIHDEEFSVHSREYRKRNSVVCHDLDSHLRDEDYSMHTPNIKSRHSVLRNDSDSHLDNVMFDGESVVALSSVSSNLSLNSWCSSVSQNSRDSQDNNPPSVFHCNSQESQEETHTNGNVVPWTFYNSPNKEGSGNGSRSPFPANRTSPVAVPVPGHLRQRNESSSSGGSWQMISGTGSLRGSTTANALLSENLASSLACKPLCETCTGYASQESSTTIVDDDASTQLKMRKEKLQCLRNLFYGAYNTVGFKVKEFPESSGFGQFLGNFAEKVGFISVQRTSL
ncbi:myotubularin-related protein 14 isoform X2 [Belonocnema kinseyi]|uniref:myotubularin-related protein 14 isoform X2 n=1 Tax=Belonocnema kinseyi TaxID=2817044 RepID=UPI00143DD1D3|nr:myotubularin-related protein 14 isoform X2 [Belonocnema kinseyi]